MENSYYGCENPESVSYLEFGSLNLAKKKKTIWGYWQDQAAYDLYMFARYSRDLIAFRKFYGEKEKTVETLNSYVLRSAHDKLMDYIFKYAGMLAIPEKSVVCECGSSLWGWIDEAIACDQVFEDGENISKIQNFQYIGSDISELMNDGAEAFHSGISMEFSQAGSIAEMLMDVQGRLSKSIDLFYGLSVSVRYAIRDALDLIKVAEQGMLSIYNRLSLTYEDKTVVSIYGTGKNVYIVSLQDLVTGLKTRGIHAKYCTANMQRGRDGENTVRASIAIAKDSSVLDEFVNQYVSCISRSAHIPGVETGEWLDLEQLLIQQQ